MCFHHLEYLFHNKFFRLSTLTKQWVTYVQAAWTSAGSLLEIQNLEPDLDPLNQNQHFNKISK